MKDGEKAKEQRERSRKGEQKGETYIERRGDRKKEDEREAGVKERWRESEMQRSAVLFGEALLAAG